MKCLQRINDEWLAEVQAHPERLTPDDVRELATLARELQAYHFNDPRLADNLVESAFAELGWAVPAAGCDVPTHVFQVNGMLTHAAWEVANAARRFRDLAWTIIGVQKSAVGPTAIVEGDRR